jgi:hypothetical protein
MSVRLEWDVGSERHRDPSGQPPPVARGRGRRPWKALMGIGLLVALILGVVFWAGDRIASSERVLREDLAATIAAEAAALRIGDRGRFMSLQRSASDEWLRVQEAAYDAIQSLKQAGRVQVTGQTGDITFRGQTARALVGTVIDGERIVRPEFYWRYPDGWFHVPPDYSFWGDEAVVRARTVTVRYRDLDQPGAEELARTLSEWLVRACGVIFCETPPELIVDMLPVPGLSPAWADDAPWHLVLRSPLVDGAAPGAAFAPGEREIAAHLLVERLVDGDWPSEAVPPSTDAAFLRGAIVDWLAAELAGEANPGLIADVASRLGEASVGRVLHQLADGGGVGAVTALFAQPEDIASLDWRVFFNHRLAMEAALQAAQDESAWLALYDTSDANVRQLAYDRYAASPAQPKQPIGRVDMVRLPDGVLQASAWVGAAAPDSAAAPDVVFRLIGGDWYRAS